MKIVMLSLSSSLAAALMILGSAAAQEMPKTTSERVKGSPSVKTEQLHGTVVYVEGNDLVVKMSGGEIREFKVPPSRKFIIDGHQTNIAQLKPGTELTATVTTKTTPVTERT